MHEHPKRNGHGRPPRPASLDELAAVLDRAVAPEDVFADDPAAEYLRLARLCHPDRFAPGPEQERARDAFQRLTEWHRRATARTAAETISSPLRQYLLIRQLAAGDVADVHLASAGAERYVLKVCRARSAGPLLEMEARHLRRLRARSGDRRYADYLPRPVETFCADDRRVSVFAHAEGFYTLEEIRARYRAGLDGRHLAWMFKRMLAVLGFVHACGLVHAAVTPAHLLVHAENHGLKLLDWIHAAGIGQPVRLVPTRFQAWYPPEVLQRRGAGPATDIYLAAKSLIYIAGGDPAQGIMPEGVPRLMRQFVRTCLYESPRMRPQSAWDLHEELDELLERLYGPPAYHHLVM